MKHQMKLWAPRALIMVAALLWMLSSACTKDNPIYCDDSGACPDGAACAIDQKVCSDDSFTLDRSQFFDDGVRLWSTTGNPVLKGTTDQSKATIEVVRGTEVIATPAVIDGAGNWSLQLPAGTIVDTDTELKIHLVGKDGTLEFVYKFALDDKAPTLKIMPTEVTDESKDVVTFNSIGEPAHVHQNFPVVLDGAHCANVVKYGYLFDDAAPMYGTEDRRNPMAWKIQLGVKVAIDEAKSRYRILKTGPGTIVDWTALGAVKTADGYSVNTPISRTTGPNMGEDGDFAIEWEVYDWAGRMVTGQGCWHQTILAAPLQMSVSQLATIGANSVSNWNNTDRSLLASLINGATAANIYERVMTNATAEPITFEATPIADIATLTKRVSKAKVNVVDLGLVPCTGTTGFCRADSSLPAGVTTTPDIANGLVWTAQLLAVDGNQLPCINVTPQKIRCTLPARSPDAPPVKAHLVAQLASLNQLNPATDAAVFRNGRIESTAFGTAKACGGDVIVDPIDGNTCSNGLTYEIHTFLSIGALRLGIRPSIGGFDNQPDFSLNIANGIFYTVGGNGGALTWNTVP